ncbi:hypothetical protein [Histidinibacterium aquaticum]|uniref:Uncharacterized protein n=1 Tax=Histidinibacterium aquaticum TaxID=2613962 RepID=A0A5J5GJT7_9RHOB|nr:hypothetical protein [Histidinibacterium aquaticum]KAA9007782.1 hypothetical protein F3S47_09635 [Histidinibacterium aquaticum]
MYNDLDRRRRVLIMTYQRYTEADLAWRRACATARGWFPEGDRPPRRMIGGPESPVRKIYDRRQRALEQFMAAERKLSQARARPDRKTPGMLLLEFSSA